MPDPISIALVAVGGYGKFYANALLDKAEPGSFRLQGVIDPYATRYARLDELKALGAPVYDSVGEFFSERSAELAAIASPIHWHSPQTCEALAHGASVVCEKPAGATAQDVRAMIEARDRGPGRFVAIGYQWSFSPAIQRLKHDILAGRFGQARRLRTLVLWPRDESYYARSDWAGAKRSRDGRWILDSPIHNATAHYLHNMLYLLGDSIDRSACPVQVQAELYRAYPISNFDTGAARALTDKGVELIYIASHAIKDLRGPEFVYEFEKGTVFYDGRGQTISARFADGQAEDYGDPYADPTNKLFDSMKALRGGPPVVCGPEAALPQTICVNGMQESMPEIAEFPKRFVRAQGAQGKRYVYVEDLGEWLGRCYDNAALPSELGAPWAVAGRIMDLRDYAAFPRSPNFPLA